MRKWLKSWASVFIIPLLLINVSCSQSPVRNPFAGIQEPKLGELPAATDASTKVAQVMWSTNTLGKQERFSKLIPHINAKTIYAADHTGKVVALERENGKKIWTSNTGKKFTAGPSLVMNNLLLLTTSDAKVVALEASSGRQLWETKVSSEVLASPAGEKGVVLVHAMDGSVSALDSRNGELLWHVEQSSPALTLRFSSSPVIAGENVLVGFSTGKLVALNLHSGLIEWERPITLPRGRSELQRMVDISADPIVIGESAYVITYQGKLAAVNISSGDLIWEREISSYQNMAASNDHLYVTDNAHCLWAIDRHSGVTLWKQAALAERYITGPVVIDKTLAVADRGGYVHFLSTEKGHLLNHLQVAKKLYQSPVAADKALVIHAQNGKMALLQLTTASIH